MLKRILAIAILSVLSFSAMAGTLSPRIMSVNFDDDKHLAEISPGLSYTGDSVRLGIFMDTHDLLNVHALKMFPVNHHLSFGAGLNTGYRADSQGHMQEDFGNLRLLVGLNIQIVKGVSVFIAENSASLELNF